MEYIYYVTVKEVVSEKKWIRKNGKVVTQKTKTCLNKGHNNLKSNDRQQID